MSVLAFPRLYLRGEMSWDPPVSNNRFDAYNSGTAGGVFRLDEDADTFRARMIRQTVERGDWNYFGTHRCLLEETTIVGGTLAPSKADIVAAEDDPMITAPVQLAGKLVDIDPYGVVSQIFFDELIIGVPGRPHLRAQPRRRMSARWITFVRNRTRLRLVIAGPAAPFPPDRCPSSSPPTTAARARQSSATRSRFPRRGPSRCGSTAASESSTTSASSSSLPTRSSPCRPRWRWAPASSSASAPCPPMTTSPRCQTVT